MSPCCLAAAAVAAVTTALTVAGLSALVLAADRLGRALLIVTAAAAAAQRLGLMAADPRSWYALSALLAARAAWLLATARRPLVVAVWRAVLPRASWAALHLMPARWARRARTCRGRVPLHPPEEPHVIPIGPGPA